MMLTTSVRMATISMGFLLGAVCRPGPQEKIKIPLASVKEP